MSILVEVVRSQSLDAIGVLDFFETVPRCTNAVLETKNSIAISFIEFNELIELQFPEASFPLVKEILKKFRDV